VTSKVIKCSGVYPTLSFVVHTILLIEEKEAHLSKGDCVDEKDNDGGTTLHEKDNDGGTTLHFVISDPLHSQQKQARAR
jgi:hypothetical protein